MELVLLATCDAGNCPTVYAAADGQVVVQGYVVDPDRPDAPERELMVRLPRAVYLEGAARLAALP